MILTLYGNSIKTESNCSQCIGITWYLAVDMQLFWLSPILLIMLKKQPKIGLITILIACVTGMIINFVNAYVNSINLDVVSIE